ncbi:uncharacterized protein [Garra rufa]|uniref:uncharacterized protein n=1 Tax=Garra rufa TaxID=137080 RepID=UPI003CCEDB9B
MGVFNADGDEVKSVSVMEGDFVTLNPDPTQTQGFILILWRFGDPVIAQINGKDTSYPSHTEIFRGRLQLDQTGSLTIMNMKVKHSGLYKLEVIQKAGTSNMKFTVTVYETPSVTDAGEAEMKLMSVKEGDPVILQTVVPQLYRDELIVWRFGDEGKLIAKRDVEAKSSPLYIETDERFRGRLELDHQTGSLIITNTRTTDSGLYKVKISSNKQNVYQKYVVTISGSGLSSTVIAGIVVAVLLVAVAAAAAAGMNYYCHKIAEEPKTVTGMEGEDVKLNTGITEIRTGDQIEWQSGNEDSLKPTAKIIGGTNEITTSDYVHDGIFRDRLEVDRNTGSLTITNSRIEHTGVYKLLINGTCKKTFTVFIRDSVKSRIVTEEENVILDTNTEIQTDEEIRWLFGAEDTQIADIKVKLIGGTKVTTKHDDTDQKLKDRLTLNETTGSLTIKNIGMNDAGLYKLLILSKGRTSCRKFFVYVVPQKDK